MSDRPFTRDEAREISIAFFREWPAWVHFDGWAGCAKARVTVIGETPKRWRVMYEERFQYGQRIHDKLDIVLVPKRSVTERAEPSHA